MSLIKLPGVNCIAAFDSIFSSAHSRCLHGGGKDYEPHFVRNLISKQTVDELNSACSTLYDSTRNRINFRAAFLHHSPFARFTPAQGASCRRELADAMFVLHETEPDAAGVHTVVRRSACMLMFKASDASAPRTLAFDPGVGTVPKGTDEQQFYLFNRWPDFSLETGTRFPKVHGSFKVAIPSGIGQAVAHDIGQYAVVWRSTTGAGSPWTAGTQDVHWLAGEPSPNIALNPQDASLGTLLDKFVAGNVGMGRDFQPKPAVDQTWDGLIGTLLGYPLMGPVSGGSPLPIVDGILKGKGWASQARDVNPLGIGFMTSSSAPLGMGRLESIDTALATLTQQSLDWSHAVRAPASQFDKTIGIFRYYYQNVLAEVPPIEHFPVLIVTINRFQPKEGNREPRRMTRSERVEVCRGAFESIVRPARPVR